MDFIKDLSTPMLGLSGNAYYTLREAMTHIQIFGSSGGGKTSGPGRMIAGAFLRAGMGGLVTMVKPEIDLWRRYAAEHGRESSLIIFDETESFNFLAYLLSVHGIQGINAVVECLMRLLEAARRASGTATQRAGEVFWEDSARMILRYAIPLVYSAIGTLSIGDIIRFISTAPAHAKDVTDTEWQRRSFMYEVMEAAAHRPKVPMARSALQDAITFWSEKFCEIPDRTKGNILITVTTTLDRFLHGRLNRVFCGGTSLVPEMTFHGAIILLAMPTLTWNDDGIIAQQLLKYVWQNAVLRRNSLSEKHRERPVFLFSDEAQETVSSYDGEFLGMCRASRCCVTYLTQSLPTYYAKIGGDNPRDAAESLVGKAATHLYLSNACPVTNEYAARMIGKVATRRANYSSGTSQSTNTGMTTGLSENSGSSSNSGHSSGFSYGQGGRNRNFNSGFGRNRGTGSNWGENRSRGASENVSHGFSEAMEYAVEPGEFARILKTGGEENNNRVSGIWFQSGRIFKSTGTNFTLEEFQQ